MGHFTIRGINVFDRRTLKVVKGLTSAPKCPSIPSFIPMEEINGIDKREALAKSFYEIAPVGKHFIIYKTTRAGATINLVSEPMARNEPIVVIEPTKNIAKELEQKIKLNKVSGKFTRCVTIFSNKECLKTQKLIEEYPDLKKLRTIPLPKDCGVNCEHYIDCRVIELIKSEKCVRAEEFIKQSEEKEELLVMPCPSTCLRLCDRKITCEMIERRRKVKIDAVIMTPQKCAALVLSEGISVTSAAILEKIREISKNVLFDECHKLQFEKIESIVLKAWSKNSGICTSDFTKYDIIDRDEYKSICKVLDRFNGLVYGQSVTSAINDVIDNVNSSNLNKIFQRHFSIDIVSKSNTESLAEQNKMLKIEVFKEIVELMKNRQDSELSVDDVLQIYKMLAVVTAPKATINAVRVNGNNHINISAVDSTYSDAISSFLMSMQNGRRIVLTSATIGSFDYGRLFMGRVKPHPLLWGKGGDPLKTNSKMLILADSYNLTHVGKNSFQKRKNEIISYIIKIRNAFPDIKIIAMSAMEALEVRKGLSDRGVYINDEVVDYYNSDKTIGVESHHRSLIIVNIAHKPTNTYDPATQNAEESYKMYWEAVHSDTWQAISRVKDPEGVLPSVVFAIGVNFETCVNVSKWGKDRKIAVTEENGKKRYTVTFDSNKYERISFPKIKQCKSSKTKKSKGMRDMLETAIYHMSKKQFF